MKLGKCVTRGVLDVGHLDDCILGGAIATDLECQLSLAEAAAGMGQAGSGSLALARAIILPPRSSSGQNSRNELYRELWRHQESVSGTLPDDEVCPYCGAHIHHTARCYHCGAYPPDREGLRSSTHRRRPTVSSCRG